VTDLTEQLRRGVLAIARSSSANGEALPGENELARRLGANRQQVRRVLSQLEQQGIVRRHQGAATTVDPIALRMTVRLEDQLEHRELLERLGYESSVELLEHSRESLTSPVSDMLDVAPGSPALRAIKRWGADGRPAMLAENLLLLPEHTGDGEDPADGVDPARSIFELAELLWREPIVWEIATPGVENIAEPQASLLGMNPGDACITFTIVGVLHSGKRVLHAFERHHPDIVQYALVRRFPEPWS
jgi:GntR family transcriptional regulator